MTYPEKGGGSFASADSFPWLFHGRAAWRLACRVGSGKFIGDDFSKVT